MKNRGAIGAKSNSSNEEKSSKSGTSEATNSKLKKTPSLDKKDGFTKRPTTRANASTSDHKKLIAIPVTIVLAASISWFYTRYLASLVNTPLSEPRVINESLYKSPENIDRFWGTYR